MDGNELRRALREGRRVYGTLIVSPSPIWPSVVKGSGLDFVFIDTEHVPIDRHMLAWMCSAYAEAGLPPVVRVPSPDPFEVSKVVDGGSCGVIAPYVESAEEVRRVVGAAKLRPLKGQRLRETLADPSTLENQLREYLEERNSHISVIVNIESVPAMKNLDSILEVPGLDAILIGPHDLSCSLGIPERYDDPLFDAAVRGIIGKARTKGIGAGIHYSGDVVHHISWAKSGANLIVHGSDKQFFSRALRSDVAKLRGALGDMVDSEYLDRSDAV